MALKPQKALIESSFDQRGRGRRKLRLEINAQGSGIPSTVAVVHDISETGLLIEVGMDLAVGDVIDVELAQTNVKPAEVMWMSGDLAGCKFFEHLTSGSISAALLQGSFPLPAPNIQFAHSGATLSGTTHLLAESRPDQLSFIAKISIISSLALMFWAIVAAMAFWLIF